jgi:hypothetical protein
LAGKWRIVHQEERAASGKKDHPEQKKAYENPDTFTHVLQLYLPGAGKDKPAWRGMKISVALSS